MRGAFSEKKNVALFNKTVRAVSVSQECLCDVFLLAGCGLKSDDCVKYEISCMINEMSQQFFIRLPVITKAGGKNDDTTMNTNTLRDDIDTLFFGLFLARRSHELFYHVNHIPTFYAFLF